MKLSLIVSALAALGAVACGGNGRLVVGGCDPADPYCPPGPSASGSSGSSGGGTTVDGFPDASAASPDAGRAEASVAESGASVSAGEGGATDPGVCAPGNACGGLWECTDDCYTTKCCVLDCSCSDPTGATGTLDCALTCP